ncbi:DUF1501 domain-containing protein [Sphingomonas sp.]|jgi:uncharacterized protein (DUF1501 family)|uniref:DUF1501 domain-containing protein n=1 Tax=Sphingomonas sp. TaxID=28214 RepID=UPI0026352601|nr:DUF1501 domain-containing protein [Sphingomonas sp.]MDF2495982.1 hypothetical protein [Sphingomonas sp.]
MIDRRTVLVRTGLMALSIGMFPRIAFARAETDQRFVFIIQRGAADGLGIVAPVGDPAFAPQRGLLAQDFTAAARLDSTFALHPAMTATLELYRLGQAQITHAVASPYRERSHFDGQNVLETGGRGPYQLKDGWLNRMLTLIPSGKAKAIAVSATVPLALRGGIEVSSYAPANLPDASEDLLTRVSMMYDGDPHLHGLWSEALATRELAGKRAGNQDRDGAATGGLAARLLAPAEGARIATIETSGWDTHIQQRGRMAANLKALDEMIGALRSGLGSAWASTTVLVATEFGRTVAVNGTGGTDHGTGAVTMLFGGAIQGGRVDADWPGLSAAQLYEGRDLRPTINLTTVIAAAVARAYGLDPRRVAQVLFPTQPTRSVLAHP